MNPEHVGMVREAGKDKCVLFLVGQSALEGHLMPYPVEEVAQAINDYWDEEVDEPEDDDE